METVITNHGVVPVVVLESDDDSLPLCAALTEGGLPVAEVTFRTEAAESAIRKIAEEMPDMLLGAGTVLSEEQLKRAIDAGARFIVTPGFNPKIVEAALKAAIPIIPGVNSPTQVEMAMSFSLSLLKFFPAEASGGRSMLKALAGPYGDVKFVPTGGIGPNNLSDYLQLKNVAACGGSWMVSAKFGADQNFEEITKLTRQAVEIVRSAR
ncbi:MAG: bifunctional 4-hydroxy-2-oxoglutarate aldolase/2-dehydro-3-deoxy-phosphogluconate aldolase [Rhizobiaceae bacterium]